MGGHKNKNKDGKKSKDKKEGKSSVGPHQRDGAPSHTQQRAETVRDEADATTTNFTDKLQRRPRPTISPGASFGAWHGVASANNKQRRQHRNRRRSSTRRHLNKLAAVKRITAMKLESEDAELQTDHDDGKWAASITKFFDAKWKCNASDQVHRLREARRVDNQDIFRVSIDKSAEVTDRIKNSDRCDDDKVCLAAWLGLDA